MDLYLYTSEDCADIINTEFLIRNVLWNFDFIKEIISTWREFALYEYSIYQRYDNVTITFSSFYIGLSLSGYVDNNSDNDLMQSYEAFIEKSNIVSLTIIQQCSKDIYTIFQLSDNQNNDFKEIMLLSLPTRANSDCSITQLFTQYDNDSSHQ